MGLRTGKDKRKGGLRVASVDGGSSTENNTPEKERASNQDFCLTMLFWDASRQDEFPWKQISM